MSRFATAAIVAASVLSVPLLSGCVCLPPYAYEGPVHPIPRPDYSAGPAFPYGWYPTWETYSGGYDYLGYAEWPGANP